MKCACQAIGIVNLELDFGIQLQAIVRIDASVALAIGQRQGQGKFRHIAARWLWRQERVKAGDVATSKVHGKERPADFLAKHLLGDEIKAHLRAFGFEVVEGRADKSLSMNASGHDHIGFWITDRQFTVRVHNEPRRDLYGPFQRMGAPELSYSTSLGITHGVSEDGATFLRQGNWTCKISNDIDVGPPPGRDVQSSSSKSMR